MDKVINILLVEDDVLDATDMLRTLDKMQILYHIDIAKNGEEALAILENTDNHLPDVVLLDLNMPRMNGLELLEAIRENDRLKFLKCFVVTTSSEMEDMAATQSLGVSG